MSVVISIEGMVKVLVVVAEEEYLGLNYLHE